MGRSIDRAVGGAGRRRSKEIGVGSAISSVDGRRFFGHVEDRKGWFQARGGLGRRHGRRNRFGLGRDSGIETR